MRRRHDLHRTIGAFRPTEAAGGGAGPTILGVTEETPAETSIFISWTLSEPADGFIEYGLTDEYGTETTFEPNLLTFHRQLISGLAAGTTYHYRIVSRDSLGNSSTHSGDFTTAGAVAPPPDPTPSLAVYGPAIAARAKGNHEMHGPGDPNGWCGYRFRAVFGGTVSRIRSAWTNRAVPYGQGDGGTYRVGIQSLNASGLPTGTWLGSFATYSPGIHQLPWGYIDVPIPGGPTLVAGQSYAIVYQNVHANPATNYTSMNNPWAPDNTSPWQPLYPNNENAVLINGPSWQATSSYVPGFDLVYTSGKHEGIAAIQGQDNDYNPSVVGIVSSSSRGRWSFTKPAGSSSISVDAVSFWMQKASGSTNATVTVEVNNSVVATGTFATSGSIGTGSRAWARAVLSGTVEIEAGDFVEVFVDVSSGSYRLPLMLYRDSYGGQHMQSWPYSENNGSNPHRADDGPSGTTPCWPSWYAHTTFGCYFEVA